MTFALSFNIASHRSSENGRLPIQLRRSLGGTGGEKNPLRISEFYAQDWRESYETLLIEPRYQSYYLGFDRRLVNS